MKKLLSLLFIFACVILGSACSLTLEKVSKDLSTYSLDIEYLNDSHTLNVTQNLNLKNPTVTGLISRLEKKGYMKREKSSKGPNYKSVLITDEGIRIIEEGKRITDNVEKEMFSVLDKDEKKELTRLLQKVIDSRNLKN